MRNIHREKNALSLHIDTKFSKDRAEQNDDTKFTS